MTLNTKISTGIRSLLAGTAFLIAGKNLTTTACAEDPKPSQSQVQDLDGKMKDPAFAQFVSAEHRRAKALSEKYIPELKEITKNPFIKTNWIVTPDVIKFLKFFSQTNPSLKDNPEFQKQLQESLDLHSGNRKDRITHGFTLVFASKNPNSPNGFEAKTITILREGLFDTSFEDVLAIRLHEDLHIAIQINETIPNMFFGKGPDIDPLDTEISIFTRELQLLRQIKQSENGIDQNAMDLVIEEHEDEVKRLKELKSKKPKNKNQEQSYLPAILAAGGTLLLTRSVYVFGRKYINQNR